MNSIFMHVEKHKTLLIFFVGFPMTVHDTYETKVAANPFSETKTVPNVGMYSDTTFGESAEESG